MNIYPYVYIVTHNITGEFYIGARWANKLPAELDFLHHYKTSSTYVKPLIDNFSGQILAEFFDKNDAYEFEQILIHEHFNNPLCLNKVCYYGKNQFRLVSHTPEARAKMSASKVGKPRKPLSAETKAKLAEAGRRRPFSDESKLKVSLANKGRPSPRKGKTLSDEHRAAMSAAHKARWAMRKDQQVLP